MNDLAQNAAALLAQAAKVPADAPMPRPHEVDALVRRARKDLVSARNARTKDGPHPAVVVAVFDQVSHGLSRFAAHAPTSAAHDAVAREVAGNAARAARAVGLSADALASAVDGLLVEAACSLAASAEAAGSGTPADAGRAADWLLRVSAALARRGIGPAAERDEVELARGAVPRAMKEMAVAKQDNNLVDVLKHDATDAAWRTAGSQFVKLTREPLVGLLTRHLAPGDEAFRGKLAAFLETELGTAILASLLSAGLAALPAAGGEVPQKLSRELRVRAMADAGDVLADLLMGPLRQVIALYLQDPAGAEQAPRALPEGLGDRLEDSAVRERVGVAR